MEGDITTEKHELTSAQEGFLGDFIVEHNLAAVCIVHGAMILPMILLSPMVTRLELGEPAIFKEKDYEKSLAGLRSIFGKYMGSSMGFVGHNVEKKIKKAFDAFKSNKSPIYVNEVMWDKVKDFSKKYECVFNDIKALLTDYKENIGPKSPAKFEFNKNEEAFTAANEWLEKYLAIIDDKNDMIRWVLKDVNGANIVPVAKVQGGPDDGTTYFVPEDTKGGRRISPVVKVSEKEFFDVCDADICIDFKKTFKANKVIGRIKRRNDPANKSMKENFESAIAELCKAYMYYVCYIFIMCSEAFHKEADKKENQKND